MPDADAGCDVIATDVRRLRLQGVVLALDSGRNGDACDRASMSSTCPRCREAAHLLGPWGGTREASLADGNRLPSVEGGDRHRVLLLHCGHRPPGPDGNGPTTDEAGRSHHDVRLPTGELRRSQA